MSLDHSMSPVPSCDITAGIPKQPNEPKQETKDLGKHNPAFSPNPAENDTKVETFELR